LGSVCISCKDSYGTLSCKDSYGTLSCKDSYGTLSCNTGRFANLSCVTLILSFYEEK
jgi:hypothetical protein